MNDPQDRYILFTSGGHRYAASTGSVDAVTDLLPSFPVPDAPRFIRGVATVHGRIAALLDLSLYMGRGPAINVRNLLLVRAPEVGIAFLAENVGRMITKADILAVGPGESEFETASFTLPEGKALLLDIDALAASVEKAMQPYPL